MILRSLWVLLRWAILIGALAVVTLVATVSMVVSTEPGTRWVISQAQRFVPLDVGEVRGNLLTGLDIDYFDYQQQVDGVVQQHYRGEKVSFRWQPLALFYNAVSVQSFTAQNVQVQIPPADETAEPTSMEWPVLALPVRIELGEVDVSNIQVKQTRLGEEPATLVELQRVSGSVSLGTFNLRLTDVVVVTADYSVIADGRAALRYPYDADLNVQWQYELASATEPPELMLLSGKAKIGGDIELLTLEHQLTSPLQITSVGHVIPNLSQPPAAVTALEDPEIQLTNEIPEQALLAQWFPADTPIPVVGGRIDVKGWIADFQADVDVLVTYGEYPQLRVQANTRGNTEHINIANLQVNTRVPASDRDMALTLQGRVDWLPAIVWDLALSGTGLDPAIYTPDWPGDMTLALKTRGQLQDGQIQAWLDELDLGGQLRGREVSASGAASWADNQLQTDGLLLSMGANHIRIDGLVGDEADIRWQLEAPLLSQIDSALTGAISSRGDVKGTLENPQIELEIRANNLKWQDYELAGLDVKASSPRRDQYDIHLQANTIQAAGTLVQEVSLAATGSVEAHKIALDVISEQYGDIGLGLDSGYQQEQWQGKWTRFDVRYPQLPRWWLLRSGTSTATREKAELAELCLTTRTGFRPPQTEQPTGAGGNITVVDNTETRSEDVSVEPPELCVDGRWSVANGADINAILSAIPLRQLRGFLKPGVDIAGVIDGQLKGRLDAQGKIEGEASLQTRDGELQLQFDEEAEESYRWQHAGVTASFKNNRLNAKADIDWAPFGNLDADLNLNLDNQQLGGQLVGTFADLSPFAAFIPTVDDLRGRLVTDLNFGGTLQQPQLSGQLTLVEGGATMTELGLDIQAVGFTLDSHSDGRITFRGNAQSGEGNMQLSGEFDGLGKTDWQLTGALRGESFQVIDQSQIKARVSPDIQLSATPHEARLTGRALIPYARIDIKTLPPSATNVSSDVVFEDEDDVTELPIPMAFFMNLVIEVGEDVTFNGFGLTSGLSGRMELVKTPDRQLLTSGFVAVTDGKYKAYGQELTISRGRLVFQGPADNPALEIRAQRVLKGTNDHIVGLEIGGSLQKPTSSVYSDPPVESDGEAMALLLTGKPLSEASAGDAYAIVAAMSGIGMDGGGSFTGQIAQTLQLDELSINADDGLEHSALWMGKYLTPRLFVRYVVGLFDQSSRIGMRYQMSDRLRLEAESGEAQSVDLIYKIER